jgi:hypothetical protein
MLKLHAAEAAAQKNSSTQMKEADNSDAEHSLLLRAREEDLEKYRSLVTEAEKKVSFRLRSGTSEKCGT